MIFFDFKVFLTLLIVTNSLQSQEVNQEDINELKRQIEILSEEIEKLKLGNVDEDNFIGEFGLGPAASKIYRQRTSGVSIAGYGEILYENFSDEKDNGNTSGITDQFDYLRNIIYIGYKFNDKILFNSEIEVEHANEIFMEFGYIDMLINSKINLRAGMVLIPIGIINEYHEPPTWHGTRRPQVEQKIIPTTWRGNGGGIFGEIIPGINYRTYIVEGLDGSDFRGEDGIRAGRQKGSKAKVEDLAITGKIEYTGILGSNFGASFFYGGSGQGAATLAGDVIDARTIAFSIHGIYDIKGFELRAMYAKVEIKEASELNNKFNTEIESLRGYYMTAAYDILPLLNKQSSHYFAPFIQFESYNTHDSVPDNVIANQEYDVDIFAVGFTYKPHPNVALKFDYRNNDNQANTAVDQWNLVIGYLF